MNLDPASPRWGFITNTPKPGWADCDIAGFFRTRFGVPVGLDTDVNAAALAEYAAVQAEGCRRRLSLPSAPASAVDWFLMASPSTASPTPKWATSFRAAIRKTAIFPASVRIAATASRRPCQRPRDFKARWGASLSELPADHPGHAIIADYIAQACHMLFATLAVERVVIGGGVAKTSELLRTGLPRAWWNWAQCYLPGGARHQIAAPVYGDNAGITGAAMLADQVGVTC